LGAVWECGASPCASGGRPIVLRDCGSNTNTGRVARYAEAASINDLLISKHRSSKLDPFKDHLDARWNTGCTDAVRLTEEMQGYRGSSRTVRRYLEPLREAGSPASDVTTPPKPRQVTSWMTRHPDLATDLAKILCNRAGDRLTAWLDAAEASDLPEPHVFTAGLRPDLAAVTNGLRRR
jgi:hypothetical protein